MQAHTFNSSSHPGFTILIPLDGSDVAMKAVEYARLFPLQHVTLLHVIPNDTRIQPPLTQREKQRWADEVIPDLERVRANLGEAGIESSIEVRSGDVAEEIVIYAEQCDLIVMTTSGRGAAGRVIFGSVADRVSRGSTTPTLLIRGNLARGDMTLPTRVLVPLDGSKRAEAALPVATDLAAKARVSITLLRAVDLDDVLATLRQARSRSAMSTDPSKVSGESYEAAWKATVNHATAYLEGLAEPMRHTGLEIRTELLHGTPVFMLLAEINASDLVIMTSHGQDGYRRWLLGSVAEKLIREAKAPVLLVPSRDTSQIQP